MVGFPEQIRHFNPQSVRVFSFKTDYSKPLWETGQLEIGAKLSQSETDNDLLYESLNGADWLKDNNLTNHFVYTEKIGAAYVNLNRSFGKWDVQAGLRGEYTASTGDLRTTSEKNDTSYMNIFPTVFVNYQPSEMHNIVLSYSRRLTRPNYDEVNPFEIKTDAYSFIAGNPFLAPSYSHDIELSYTFRQKIMTQLSYSYATGDIIQVPVNDPDNNRHGVRPYNFGINQDIALMLTYSTSIGSFWQLSFTGQGFYQKTDSPENMSDYTNSKFAYYFSLNNTFNITSGLSAELSGLYQSKLLYGYFQVKPVGSVTVGFRQRLFDNKCSISLNFEDVFYNLITDVSTSYTGLSWRAIQYQDSRRVLNGSPR
jgi:hypothetical protein